MKWTKLIIRVNPLAVEAVANRVMEIGIEGIEIDDGYLSEEDKAAMYVGYVSEDIKPLDEHKVIAYLDETQDVQGYKALIEKEIEGLRTYLEVGSGSVEIEIMPEEDYENKWKEFYHSFRVGDNIVITPIWEEVNATPDEIVIKIDPGMAFGSGTHETTSLCIEALQNLNLLDKKVLDVGCGSGILGIAAAKLFAKAVVGIDIDENAVAIAKENVIHNEVDHTMTVVHGNLLEQIHEKQDVIVANILADVIRMIAKDVHSLLENEGVFIASGIILDQAELTKATLLEVGFSEVTTIKKGEWVMLLAK